MIVTKSIYATLSAYIPNVIFRKKNFNNLLFQIITKGCKNDRRGLVLSPAVYTCRKSYKKKKDRNKKYGNKKWSLSFHDKLKPQNRLHTAFCTAQD